MDVTIWPEPFCFVKTPAEQKITKQFPLTQEGCLEAVAWLNEQHKPQLVKPAAAFLSYKRLRFYTIIPLCKDA